MDIRLLLVCILITQTVAAGPMNETLSQDNLTRYLSDPDPGTILTRFEDGEFDTISEGELLPYRGTLYKALAQGLASRGEYKKAIDLLTIIPPEEQSRELLTLLAFMYCRIGAYESAVSIITDLRVRYPDDPKLDNAMAYILCISGDHASAGRIQERALKQLPDYPPALDTWGTILAARGDLREADSFLLLAHQAMPDDAEVASHLAGVYARTGRMQDAQDLFQEAVKREPAFGQGQKEYARILKDLGRIQEAVQVIRAALRLMPGDPDLITWERELDATLLSWHTRQEQEAKQPGPTKRRAPVNHS